MISYRHKFVFIHIPKTGGTSIAKILFGYCDHIIKHQFAQDIITESGQYNDYFKFAIVRNPWAREVSRYHYQRKTPSHEFYKEANKLSFKKWLKKRHKDKTFMDFYGAPMLDWISDDPGNIIIDFIARLETINKDWPMICSKLKIDSQLPVLNISEHKHYTVYYDDETREMIARAYEKDIKYFGYKYGD